MVIEQSYNDNKNSKAPAWHNKKVGDIAKVIRGASPRPQGDPRYYGGSVPRLMVSDVTRDKKYVTPSTDFLTEEGAKLSRPMKAGSLVVVCSGTVGVPAILAIDSCIHDGFLGLADISDNCDIEYLYYAFSALKDKFNSSATHGGIFTNLTTQIMKDFNVLIPPMSEQLKITAILSSIDDAIEKTEAIIEQTKKINTALMQQLLTKGIGHSEFKITEIGEIPVNWHIYSFSNLFTVKHGYAFKSEYFSNDGLFLLLTPGNFESFGGLKLKGDKEKFYTGEFPSEYLLKKGDLLVVMTDLTQECKILGSPAFVPSDNLFLHNQRLGKVEKIDKAKLTSEYLYNLFNSHNYRKHLFETATGTTVRHTSPSRIGEVKVALPSKEEQEKITAVLSSITRKLIVETERVASLHSLKQALMQSLLTGKVRVTVDENSEVVV
ncbi:hypothetical protein BSK62_22050 [Paenibacillus odorifer]|uniref:restriction endonuclease subunit S n=1 Tax=Paenibacillus odorifer TaxID=189426 RepID=UPI00096FE9B7|nr:restriction endonuclease subunit S [Paenibacillus odorifer]OMD62993.1 hypothetical protein BSK62_22050 [Paenibacillus odorifer]